MTSQILVNTNTIDYPIDLLEKLWVDSFRYSLGQCVSDKGMFCRQIINFWHTIPVKAQAIIAKELNEAFERDDFLCQLDPDGYSPLGDKCDKQEWSMLRQFINSINLSN